MQHTVAVLSFIYLLVISMIYTLVVSLCASVFHLITYSVFICCILYRRILGLLVQLQEYYSIYCMCR